jgi:hypothetical protein
MKPRFPLARGRFLAPPMDEIELHRQARAILARPGFDLDAFLGAADIDLANCVLYHAFLRSRHGSFVAEVDSLPAAALPSGAGLKVILVPGMFYREHPEVGADGALLEGILRKCGFEVERAGTDSRGSVAGNAAIVRAAMEAAGPRALWLVSLSRGSAEVRHCLQGYAQGGLPPSLRGWLNFSGIFSGSILADIRTGTPLRRLLVRSICRLAGVAAGLPEELSRSNPLWRTGTAHLDGIRLVHVLGFPLRSHVQPMLSHRFAQAAAFGPTDGVVGLRAALGYSGKVYPVWGCDHFARSPRISALAYRLAHLMAETPANAPGRLFPKARAEAA